ncbi:MAG: acetyl xylan esterase-like protein [Pseudomonadota bacterium]
MVTGLTTTVLVAAVLMATVSCGNDAGSRSVSPIGALEPSPASGGAPSTTPEDVALQGQAGPGESPNPQATLTPEANAATAGSSAVGTDGAGDSSDGAGSASAAGGAAGAGAMGSSGAAGIPTPLPSPFPSDVLRPQIMIVGDSISAGPGCYKKYLLADLTAAGYTSFDFVGEYADDCGGGVRHSARSCSTAVQYAQPTFTLAAGSCNPSGTFPGMSQLVAQYQPDLVLLQLGVNDVWGGSSTDAILASYTTLVEQARAQNPNVVIAVAQIQQIRPTADGEAVFARAEQLIRAVPAWAQAQSQLQSPVFVADLWTSSSTAETLDGVHPNDAGAQRMGRSWFDALAKILPQR